MGKIKFELEVGNYEEIECFDLDHIQEIKELNKEVRRKKYMEKKVCSKFSLEQIERKFGQIASPILSPLEQMIAEEENLEKIYQTCIDLAFQALNELPEKQREAFYKVKVLRIPVIVLAKEKKCTVQCVYYLCNCARKKLKRFYKKYPEILSKIPLILELI